MNNDDRLNYNLALEDAGQALGMLTCPYLRGAGSCRSGCYDEPECITGAPVGGDALNALGEQDGGWSAQLLAAARQLHDAEVLRAEGGFEE